MHPPVRMDISLAGCGTVGSALLSQLAERQPYLAARGLELRLVAVARSRVMAADPGGLDPASWREAMADKGAPLDLGKLAAMGKNLSNPVLVDCTASEALPDAYALFMESGFDVVSANKRGNAGPLPRYRAIREAARASGAAWLCEATVGAGLPVMENFRKLMLAGDRLESFSGALSGSLSFLFGRLEEGAAFSEALGEAMASGFTEPDPRDDLSGLDVARKVLILARESGLELELADVALEGLIPGEYLALSADGFKARAAELDGLFEKRRRAAAERGEALRFAGSIEGGRASAGLVSVGPTHPLSAVKGGENALAFRTRYYDEAPLVVRGYGAGAVVTAAGVFGDVLRCARRAGSRP